MASVKHCGLMLGLLTVVLGCYALRDVQEAPGVMLVRPCKVSASSARCEDGVVLPLHRYQGQGAAPGDPAVVLCHGIGCDGKVFDLEGRLSLARYLGSRGLDVWVPNLRGCAGSTSHGSTAPILDCTMDDYVNKDVPAVLKTVREQTHKERILWVGHNLGASIALAYAATHPDEAQHLAIVAIGATMTGQRPYPPVLSDEAAARQRLMSVTSRFPSVAHGPKAPQGWEALFYNPEHLRADTLKRAVHAACVAVPPGVARQFVAMLRGGDLCSSDGKIVYAARMKDVKCPALFICGKADNLADTGGVRALYQSVSSEDKTFRLFCLTNGDGADFGNLDLLLGPRSSVDVYPEVLRWAQKHP